MGATVAGGGSRHAGGFKLTPVMQQYLDIKAQHEDAVLFFRMGDFYEMFFEDAEKAASILDITLTSRNRNEENPVPMCGVPYHSVRPYIARMLEAGVRVAICEQVEMPQKGGALAKRKVTRVVSPGTTLDEESLAPEKSNYLAAVLARGGGAGLSITDFSTGEVRATQFSMIDELCEELVAMGPSEVVVSGEAAQECAAVLRTTLPGCMVDVPSLAVPDDRGLDLPVAAHRFLLAYVSATQGGNSGHLREPDYYSASAFLRVDEATRRNLELVEAARGGLRGSLVSVLDRCSTPMGKRLLRRWLLHPLADLEAIGARLDAVELLVADYELRNRLREGLKVIGDLERLNGRLGSGTAGPRDVLHLTDALDGVDSVEAALAGGLERQANRGALESILRRLDSLPVARTLIRETLCDEPPLSASKGGVIRDGFHEEVDRLRTVRRDGKSWIASFEADERTATGIASLKVGFNKVFGYYLEVTRSNQHLVPERYVRKQTLANAERYITEELKQRESEVLGAEERLGTLESHLFSALLEQLAGHHRGLGKTGAALAELDTLCGLAESAHYSGYCRPEFHDGCELLIRAGRHPVVEAGLGSRFVANDCVLGDDSRLLMVITGPNMAGKSTYLRQVALIALLAHCGSFVPATEARIPLLDRIFTRIGASDDLAAGKSTFMVEMSETADILGNMTDRSLVVLDEIGRGTSTFDGISIAWAVAEAMVKAGVKTLFATHYHELAGLASEYAAVENFSVAIRRYKEEMVFLYRVTAGPSSGSYGIEVARAAGVAAPVIEKARAILAKFEAGEGLPGMDESPQLALFAPSSRVAAAGVAAAPGNPEAAELLRRISNIDAETLSPLEALNVLAELVEQAKKAQ